MAFKRYERRLDAANLSVRSADEGAEGGARPITLSGYAAVFDDPTTLYADDRSKVVERIKPGAFSRAISEGQDVRALVDHNPSLLLGRTKAGTLTLREDDRGLAFELRLPDTQLARDLAENVRLGNVSQCSFAFVPAKGGESSKTEDRDGVDFTEIELTDLDLYDVSIVTYPAYASTTVSIDERGRAFANRKARTAPQAAPRPQSQRHKSAALKVADRILSRHPKRAS